MSSPLKIGILAPRDPGYVEALRMGIRDYARPHHPWVFRNANPIVASVRDFVSWGVRGLIVFGNSSDLNQAVIDTGLPAVNVSAYLASPGIPSVVPDNHAVGRMAAEHLLERGFDHLGYLSTHDNHYAAQRQAGFAARARQHGLDCHTFTPPTPASSKRWGDFERALIAWLWQLPKPVGILAATDPTAERLLEVCLQAGIDVPEQIAVLGVDDTQIICESTWPHLSSVAIPFEQIGFRAAAMLDDLIHRRIEAGPQTLIQLPPRYVVPRQSTNVLAISDDQVIRAVRYIEAHLGEPLSVDQIVAHLTISRRMLEHRFKRALGRTPAQQITRVRIDRARQLLAETDLDMTSLAHACGYANNTRFGVAFKRVTGTTPTAYRKAKV